MTGCHEGDKIVDASASRPALAATRAPSIARLLSGGSIKRGDAARDHLVRDRDPSTAGQGARAAPSRIVFAQVGAEEGDDAAAGVLDGS